MMRIFRIFHPRVSLFSLRGLHTTTAVAASAGQQQKKKDKEDTKPQMAILSPVNKPAPVKKQRKQKTPRGQTTGPDSTMDNNTNDTDESVSTPVAKLEEYIQSCANMYLNSLPPAEVEQACRTLLEEFCSVDDSDEDNGSVTKAALEAAVPQIMRLPPNDPQATEQLWKALVGRQDWLDANSRTDGPKLQIVYWKKCKIVTIEKAGNEILVEGIAVHTMKEVDGVIDGVLSDKLLNRPNVQNLKLNFEHFSSVPSVAFIENAVSISGTPPTLDAHAPTGKRYATVVYGDSGAGKTVYSCFTIPHILGMNTDKDDVVIHVKLADVAEALEEIEKLEKEVEKKTTPCERFRVAVARDVVRDSQLKELYEKKCDLIFRERRQLTYQRDTTAVDAVIDILRAKFNCSWAKEEEKELEKFNKVVLVLDEIGKCLPLARAVAASIEEISTHEWVKRRMQELRIVLCGTGSDSLCRHSTTRVATDPRTIRPVHVLRTTADFARKLRDVMLDGRDLPELRDALHSDKLVSIVLNNARMGALLAVLVKHLCTTVIPSGTNAFVLPRLLQLYDRMLADNVSLGVVAALISFTKTNGLDRQLTHETARVMEAAFIYIQRKHPVIQLPSPLPTPPTLIPLPPPRDYDKLLDDAGGYGLLVRGAQEEMSQAAALVVMGIFGMPCDYIDGAELEVFTHGWLLRLFQAQSGLPARSIKFGTRQLPMRTAPMDAATLRRVLDALEETGSVAILNGENAPGADVMGVQVRPSYSSVAHHMTEKGYGEVWMDGVLVREVLFSNKKSKQGHYRQLQTVGVVSSSNAPTDQAMPSPALTEEVSIYPEGVNVCLTVKLLHSTVTAICQNLPFTPGDVVVLRGSRRMDVGEVTSVSRMVRPNTLNTLVYPVSVELADKERRQEWMTVTDRFPPLLEKLNSEVAPILSESFVVSGMEQSFWPDNVNKVATTMQYTTEEKELSVDDIQEFLLNCNQVVPSEELCLQYASVPATPANAQMGPLVLALLGVRAWTAREYGAGIPCVSIKGTVETPEKALCYLLETIMKLDRAIEWARTSGAGAPAPVEAVRRLADAVAEVSVALEIMMEHTEKTVEVENDMKLAEKDARRLIFDAWHLFTKRAWKSVDSASTRLLQYLALQWQASEPRMTAGEAMEWARAAVGQSELKMRYAQHVADTELIAALTKAIRRSDVTGVRSMLTDALAAAQACESFKEGVSATVVVSPGIVCGEDGVSPQPQSFSDVLSGPEFDGWVHPSCQGKYIVATPKNIYPLSNLMESAAPK